LREIAQQLNIGLDSLVFIDDNPAERAIVRQLAPEVAVPELPEDVTGYIRAIEQQRYFQVLAVAPEDFQRTDFYQADKARREVQSSATDMESFLRSLEMKARIGPINTATLERAVQLIHRSNQFNLTTRRHSVADIKRILDDPGWVTRTVSLSDRFGDNGLISVLLAQIRGETLEIDTWLMSCRVLKRGVEQFLLNHICALARQRGLKTVRGVRDHYPNLGFARLEETDETISRWELRLEPPAEALQNFIREELRN